MIKKVAKVIVALNGNLGRRQIAMGFSWGILLGLIPAGNVFWIALFIISFMFRHHHSSKFLVMGILKITFKTYAQWLDLAGWRGLTIEGLEPFYTSLYNTPFVPFTNFNNTLVAGGLVCGIILWLPVFLLIYLLIPLYRNNLAPWIRNHPLVKSIKGIPWVNKLLKAFEKYQDATRFLDGWRG